MDDDYGLNVGYGVGYEMGLDDVVREHVQLDFYLMYEVGTLNQKDQYHLLQLPPSLVQKNRPRIRQNTQYVEEEGGGGDGATRVTDVNDGGVGDMEGLADGDHKEHLHHYYQFLPPLTMMTLMSHSSWRYGQWLY